MALLCTQYNKYNISLHYHTPLHYNTPPYYFCCYNSIIVNVDWSASRHLAVLERYFTYNGNHLPATCQIWPPFVIHSQWPPPQEPPALHAASRLILAALFRALGFALLLFGSNSPRKSLGMSLGLFAYRRFE